jgi:hypothetical protein
MHTAPIIGAGLDRVDVDRFGVGPGVGGSDFMREAERLSDTLDWNAPLSGIGEDIFRIEGGLLAVFGFDSTSSASGDSVANLTIGDFFAGNLDSIWASAEIGDEAFSPCVGNSNSKGGSTMGGTGGISSLCLSSNPGLSFSFRSICSMNFDVLRRSGGGRRACNCATGFLSIALGVIMAVSCGANSSLSGSRGDEKFLVGDEKFLVDGRTLAWLESFLWIGANAVALISRGGSGLLDISREGGRGADLGSSNMSWNFGSG